MASLQAILGINRMLAYPDGTVARVGDLVAIDGSRTGTVTEIIESAADLKNWGLTEPGLMIDTSFGGLVYYPQGSMVDDEIRLLSRPVN